LQPSVNLFGSGTVVVKQLFSKWRTIRLPFCEETYRGFIISFTA